MWQGPARQRTDRRGCSRQDVQPRGCTRTQADTHDAGHPMINTTAIRELCSFLDDHPIIKEEMVSFGSENGLAYAATHCTTPGEFIQLVNLVRTERMSWRV